MTTLSADHRIHRGIAALLCLSYLGPGCGSPTPSAEVRRASGTSAAGAVATGTLPAATNGSAGSAAASPANGNPQLIPVAAGSKPSGTPANSCEIVRLTANQQIPDVMIVLDRSGSMERDGRWEPSVSAVRKLTTELSSKIHFGLALFPEPPKTTSTSTNDCIEVGGVRICINGSSSQTDAELCAAGKIVVPIGANQGAAIGQALDTTFSSGGTPTAETLQGLLSTFADDGPALDTVQNAKFVLLVTDGAPTCPAGNGEETTAPDIDSSNAAIEALAGKGVRTYVIGYDTTGPGNEMLASVLDGFAQRGGTGDTKHRPVEDEASLLMEMQRITSAVASCSFNLDAAPARADFVLVKLDGAQINLNDPNGWRLVGDRTIEITGQACERFKGVGSHAIEALVQCDIVVPS